MYMLARRKTYRRAGAAANSTSPPLYAVTSISAWKKFRYRPADQFVGGLQTRVRFVPGPAITRTRAAEQERSSLGPRRRARNRSPCVDRAAGRLPAER